MLKTIYKFGTSTCGPCKMLNTTLKELNWPELIYIECDDDSDEVDELIDKYRISSVPVVIFIDENGEILNRVNGNVPKSKLEEIYNTLKS